METKPHTQAEISFSNTAIAFKDKSNADLNNASLLFKTFNYKWLLQTGPKLASLGFKLGLPVKGVIKSTLFRQFCGGENIEECALTISKLAKAKIGTILDYSVEGQENETVFEATKLEIIRTVIKAADNPNIPFSVFKVTGIARFHILAKASDASYTLSEQELAELKKIQNRFDAIVEKAYELKVRIFVDAEESWIQPVIDRMVMEASKKYNRERCYVYNTVQIYRHDRLEFVKNCIEIAREEDFMLGFKIVRGAYMEKERERAERMQYPSPIQADKASCDRDFDACLKLCLSNIERVNFCAGTHNENSCKLLIEEMQKNGLAPSDKRIYFAQLLGMSDHISYNLANAGYNVAKYVPYGKVKEVLPYLVRRAEENSSVKGQAGRELSLIQQELRRRKSL